MAIWLNFKLFSVRAKKNTFMENTIFLCIVEDARGNSNEEHLNFKVQSSFKTLSNTLK